MTRILRIAMAAIGLITLIACNTFKETAEPAPGFERELVFTASREGLSHDTKTVRMEDGSTWWNASEEISVFYGSGNDGGSKFISMNTTLQEIVEFDGSIMMSGSGKEFWAVYPYSDENECDGTSITTVVPNYQIGSEGNFSGDAFPAIAKSKNLDLAFWNICGGIKFFVSRSDIKSVTFKGNNGEMLAGKVRVVFDNDGKPALAEVLDGKTEVTLNAMGGGTFKAGKYYYISLLPGALNNGFTMSFRTDTAKGQVISNNSQTIKRSVFGLLKNIDSKVQNWEDALPIPDAVDLGLSVLWATFNVGASAPEEYGNYYAYGETAPKDEYTTDNYIHPTTMEYSASSIATKLVVSEEVILTPECDAAHVAYGGEWRMPTRAECEELVEECTHEWTRVNGTSGYVFTSKIIGNSIFLPEAGCTGGIDYYREVYYGQGDGLYYWSSSERDGPCFLGSSYGGLDVSHQEHPYFCFGQSVRAVRTNPNPRHVNSLSIDKTEITLYEGRSEKIEFSTLPVTAANRKVVCTSSAPDVASVSWGDEYIDWKEFKYAYAFVDAIKAGTTIITIATVDGGFQANCKVTVLPRQEIEAVDLGLSVKWASINLGTYGPEEYGRSGDSYHEWYDVAHDILGGYWRMPTIEELTELVESCTWSWTTVHGVSGKIVTSNTNGNSIFLPASGYFSYYSDVYDNGYCGQNGYYWSSTRSKYGLGQFLLFDSNTENIVNDNLLDYLDQTHLYCLSVRPVYDDRIPPESVTLNKAELALFVGHTEQLTATVLPENLPDKTVAWSSDNTDVATVDENGNVTAIAAGSASITATSILGAKTAICEVTVTEPPMINGHEYVDLGLSVKWATFNVGATKPEEYGDFFAWGETAPKEDYSWLTYRFRVSGNSFDNVMFNKYCPSNRSGYWDGSGSPDNNTVLDPEDDAAHVNWGGSWRMPTDAEWTELINNCTCTWTTQNGVNGQLVTSKTTGNSIFIPAAGYRSDTGLSYAGSYGYYWSSSLKAGNPRDAWLVYFYSVGVGSNDGSRFLGLSVRPVTE